MPSLLDEAMKVGQELEGAERRRNALEAQIASKQQELKDVTGAAERASRDIFHEAKQSAKQLVAQAETMLLAAQQKMAEVISREQAVDWVKAEDARLKTVAAALATQQKEAEAAKGNAVAAQELYANKLKELKSWEEALGLRERAGSAGAPTPLAEKPKGKDVKK